jgi:hypothetical protein
MQVACWPAVAGLVLKPTTATNCLQVIGGGVLSSAPSLQQVHSCPAGTHLEVVDGGHPQALLQPHHLGATQGISQVPLLFRLSALLPMLLA